MTLTLATLFVVPFFFSTQDIISETHKVETVFRAACHKTGGEWINLHQPGAACINQETHLIVPDKGA